MQLFRQTRKVVIGKTVFDYKDFDIDFDIKKEEGNKSDISTISIYNLSEDTKAKIKKETDVSIVAGYEELNGVIFNGVVESVTTIRDASDFITRIKATPNNRQYTNTIVNRQFKAGIKASEIMKQLESITNYSIDIKELAKDTTYANGKAFSNRLSNVVDILAKDTGTIATFTNDTIEFKLPNKAYTSILTLGAKQGLITVAKKDEVEEKKDKNKNLLEIECLLVPIVKVGQLLDLKSNVFTGKAVVKKCRYIANGEKTFSANAVCEVVE